MMNSVVINPGVWEELNRHLFQNGVEQTAMLYADVTRSGDDVQFNVADVEYLQPSDYDFQSAYHISLKDEARGRIIKRAWTSKQAIVEMHSHVGEFAVAAFSSSDIDGLAEYVPHVMWRLRGTPYAAIVATESAFDGMVWTSRDLPSEQMHVVRVGEEAFEPTRATLYRRGAL